MYQSADLMFNLLVHPEPLSLQCYGLKNTQYLTRKGLVCIYGDVSVSEEREVAPETLMEHQELIVPANDCEAGLSSRQHPAKPRLSMDAG